MSNPTLPIDIGIAEADRTAIADGLSRVLADTYTLYLKTHNYHWNVTGPMFNTLHLMFEEQYNELWIAVDLIAERIRSLGHPAPGTYAQFAALTSIADPDGVPTAEDMKGYSHSTSQTTYTYVSRCAIRCSYTKRAMRRDRMRLRLAHGTLCSGSKIR